MDKSMSTKTADAKDWNGNKRSAFSQIGASNHSLRERESNDFYATEPIAIDALVGALDGLPHKVWECACGQGHLSERLKFYGHDVVSSDLVNRGYGYQLDFLAADRMPDGCSCIITNPPYKYALEFVLHALDILPEGGLCVMFLKTSFLEGKRRYERLFSITPPKYMLQFVKRVLCAKNGDFEKMREDGGSAVAYAWYVFEKGYAGNTTIKWI